MAARIRTLDIPSRQCRDFAAAHFSVSTMADAYVDLYARALAEAGVYVGPEV
jgi:hypothetical protein